MEEIFKAVENKQEFGVQGYVVAKTCNYFKKNYKFPKEKRGNTSKRRGKEPDLTFYSETAETQKKNWKRPNGKFLKAKKLTIIDEIYKISAKTPGPGQYYKASSLTPRVESKSKKKSTFG